MTTDGVVTDRHPIPTENANPLRLVLAPDGELWIAQHGAGNLGRTSLDGVFGRDVRTKSAPDSLAIGPDGALWYGVGDEGKVGRVDITR